MTRFFPVAIAGACLLAGCAANNSGAGAQNDPYESTNRSFYASHQVLYKSVIRPVAVTYNRAVPELVRDGVHNFLVNIDLPVTFANDLLQGRVVGSGQTLARFTVNSTAGAGGVVDVARRIGIPEHETDFADTLAAYGVGEGAYLYLPVIGPTVPRELAGKVVDSVFDPLSYVTYGASTVVSIGRAGTTYVDKRARGIETVDLIEHQSPDPYVTTRILYEKHLAEEASHTAPDEDYDSHADDVRLALAETRARVAQGGSQATGTIAPENAEAYCASVAADRADDAAANGLEPEMQQAVRDGAYQSCLHGNNAAVATSAAGVTQVSLLK